MCATRGVLILFSVIGCVLGIINVGNVINETESKLDLEIYINKTLANQLESNILDRLLIYIDNKMDAVSKKIPEIEERITQKLTGLNNNTEKNLDLKIIQTSNELIKKIEENMAQTLNTSNNTRKINELEDKIAQTTNSSHNKIHEFEMKITETLDSLESMKKELLEKTQTPKISDAVVWIPTTPRFANSLSDRALVAGYEGYDGSPLWVIRARYNGDLIPGKLAINHLHSAVPWGGKEHYVDNIEVCCARPGTVQWVEGHDGIIPPKAILAGNTSSGDPLYIARAKHEGSLTPGQINPRRTVMYLPFGGKEISYASYEVLCQV